MAAFASPGNEYGTASLTDLAQRNAFAPSILTARWTYYRGQVFAATVLIGLANGLVATVDRSLQEVGLASAVVGTFGVSAIVWCAFCIGVSLMYRDKGTLASGRDWAATSLSMAGFLLPESELSWCALTAFAIYAVTTSPLDSDARRGAIIVAAATIPLFWSKALFSLFSGIILRGDAMMVSAMTGLMRVGNTIQLDGGYGTLWLAPRCSSFANLSLTVLCWSVCMQFVKRTRSVPLLWAWCGVACMVVVLINVIRISLMAFRPDYYDLIHGAIGADVASWLTTAAIVGICVFGLHDEGATLR